MTSIADTTQLLPGLMEVVIDVRSPSLTDLAFHFNVRDVAGSRTVEAAALVGDVDRK